jgi:uncharacterized integral membrane protein
LAVVQRVATLIVGFIAAVLLVTLAVSNRHGVRLVLDPFNPQAPVISAELPFYAYLLGMLILGVVLGGVATWLSQSKWRRTARSRTQEAVRWKAEAERLGRERDTEVGTRRQLAIAGR